MGYHNHACWVADESVATVDEIQGSSSPCHRVDGGDSKDGETSGYSIPFLPEVQQQVTLIVDCSLNFTETTHLTVLILGSPWRGTEFVFELHAQQSEHQLIVLHHLIQFFLACALT